MENLDFRDIKIKVISNARHKFYKDMWDSSEIYNDEFARIYYIHEGYGYLSIRDKKRKLIPGNVYLIPSGEDFMVHHSPYMDIMSLHFTGIIDSVYDIFGLIKTPIKIPINDKEYIKKFISDIENIHEFSNTINLYKLDSLIKVLLLPFIENATLKKENINKHSIEFKNILEQMSIHCNDNIKIKDLARSIHFHKNYFPTYFKKIMGITPKEYIINERIKRAKLLLLENKMSLKEISNFLGFNDICYFSRVFKEKTGNTPGTFSKYKII